MWIDDKKYDLQDNGWIVRGRCVRRRCSDGTGPIEFRRDTRTMGSEARGVTDSFYNAESAEKESYRVLRHISGVLQCVAGGGAV
eukprot:8829788-Pyramimonas_sp.AAC.1